MSIENDSELLNNLINMIDDIYNNIETLRELVKKIKT